MVRQIGIEVPHLDEELPQVLACFRLMLSDGALFTEDGVPIPTWRGGQGFQDAGAHVRQGGQRRTSALARSEPEATRAGCWSEKPQARARWFACYPIDSLAGNKEKGTCG